MTPKLLAAGLLLLLAAAPAHGAAAKPKAPTPVTSRHLWATVDVCNTKALPRVVGIRASIPGTGLPNEEMFMRFEVEYQAGSAWKMIPKADTGFRDVGSAIYKARQAGQYFTIPLAPPGSAPAPGAPAASTQFVLRGRVMFQWRRRGHAVLRATRTTTAGHLSTAGADPAGYSAAACALPIA